MKPFDPGGAPYAPGDGQNMAYLRSHRPSSCESGWVQLSARREFFCPRGLKEGIFLEDAEKRVLHSTHRATLYLTASRVPFPALQGPSNNAQFHSVPINTEQSVHSRRSAKALDGSICSLENVAGSREGQEHTLVDFSSRVHDTFKKSLGCNNVKREQQNSSHFCTNFDESLMLSNHLGASLSCLSKSLHDYDSTSSNFTSLQASHIPSALALHVSSDEMQLASEFCIEDPEAPSTPDLQPEARSWDCKALCTMGVDQMLPADNFCSTETNDLVSGDNSCNNVADDKEEDCMSTFIIQCPAGPAKSLHALMKQGKDTCIGYSSHMDHSLSDPLYNCRSSLLCNYIESANSKNSSRKLYSSACRQYKALLSLRRLIRFLKWEGLNCEVEAIFKQSLMDLQIFLQGYKTRLTLDLVQKAFAASSAACYFKQPKHKQISLMVNQYNDRNGHLQNVHRKTITQKQVLVMLHLFFQRYLATRNGYCFWPRYIYPEQDIAGNSVFNQCSSILLSKVNIVSASKSPNLLETENRRLPGSEIKHDLEAYLQEIHGSSIWSQENSSNRIVEEVNNWNCIPIEQSEASNIKSSNGSLIDGGHQHHLVSCKDNTREAICLPMSAEDGPCSLALSQSGSNLGFSTEEFKSSMLHGVVQERQSKEKLEHFAEVFLLRRHIIQQQRRAQQAPPYPCKESIGLAADVKGLMSTGILTEGTSSLNTYSSTNASTNSSGNGNHEPTMTLTSSVTKLCDVTSSFCEHDNFVGADVVIDIVGLVKYLESHSGQLETSTDASANSISSTHMPFTGGQLVIPNVNAVIVTIVALMVYTRILLEGAFAWVGSRTQSKEEK